MVVWRERVHRPPRRRVLTDRYATSGLKWAIAGRSRERLDAVLQETKAAVHIVADATDAASVDAMVAQTKVLLNYAGSPYITKALPVVEACARPARFVDVTGEVALHRASLSKYDAKAKETGALIVHSCGYDSIPSDLGYLLASDAYQARYGAQPERARLVDARLRGGWDQRRHDLHRVSFVGLCRRADDGRGERTGKGDAGEGLVPVERRLRARDA